MPVAALIGCFVLGALAVFVLFYATTFFYTPSPPHPETGEYDVVFRPRWRAICLTVTLGMLLAVGTFVFFATVFLPASQIEEAEEIALKMFAEKQGRKPARMEFAGPDFAERMSFFTRGGWNQKGTAWMDNGEVWDVTVKRANLNVITNLQCVAIRRE